MKRMILLTAILGIACLATGITVFLDTGRDYNGDFTEFRDEQVVLSDDGVFIHVPLNRIKVVVDDGRDVTRSFLAKAESGISFDGHFLNESDYFICEMEPELNMMTEALLAKLLKAGTEENDMTGEFSVERDEKVIETQFWYKTRIARSEDIKKGVRVICFEAIDENGMYSAPEDEKEARSGSWFISDIMNTSTAKKGYVTVSGNVTVETGNLRVIVE